MTRSYAGFEKTAFPKVQISSWSADAVFPVEGNQIFFARQLLAEYAAQYRLPAIYGTSAFAEVGGLMSYGGDYVDLSRRGATYVAKILKGAKPSDLPVEQAYKLDFISTDRSATLDLATLAKPTWPTRDGAMSQVNIHEAKTHLLRLVK